MRTAIIGVVVTIALSAGTWAAMSPQQSLSRAQGLMITRMVLGIEATGRGESLDLPSVMKLAQDPASGYSARDLSSANLLDSTTVTVQDYTLRLTRSEDKKHFQVSLTPTVPKDDDRLSWFSDDRGVIFTGKPLG